MAGQHLRDLREQSRIERLVRRITIFRLAPERDSPIHAEHRKHTLLEVRTLILAVAISDAEGHILRLGERVIPPDTARGGIKVDIALLQAKLYGSPDRTGREDLHDAHGVEAIEDAADSIIIKGVRRDGLAQEQFGVLMRKKLFQTVQRATTTQRIQHQTQDDRTRVTSIAAGTR